MYSEIYEWNWGMWKTGEKTRRCERGGEEWKIENYKVIVTIENKRGEKNERSERGRKYKIEK